MTSASPPILEIAGLSKRLQSGDSVFTLVIPEFAIRRGQFYGVIGKSGSGKSTLLDMVALVSRPTEVRRFIFTVAEAGGTRSYDLAAFSETTSRKAGRAIEAIASQIRARHFGYVLQTGGLLPFLTVRQNIELPFQILGQPCSGEEIDDAARRLDLTDHLDKKPQSLSGGQRQRASVLRALMSKPALLLADEPTAAIDEAMATIVIDQIRSLAAERGAAVLMVSHDVDLVRRFADEVVHLVPQRDANGHVTTICRLEEHA